MRNWTLALAVLLTGCHVASCSRQDRFDTATWARGAIAHQAQEDHNADQTYTLSAITDTLLSGEHGPDCHGMCNDEKLLPDESPHFYECWGHFKWECEYSARQAHATVKTMMLCHGAFTFFPGPDDSQAMDLDDTPGMPWMADDGDGNKTFTMITCEGNALAALMTSVRIPTEEEKGHNHAKVFSGVACSGRSRHIASKSAETQEHFISCEDAMVSGTATTLRQGSSSSDDSSESDFDDAIDALTGPLTEHGSSWAWSGSTPTSTGSDSSASGQQPQPKPDHNGAVTNAQLTSEGVGVTGGESVLEAAFKTPGNCVWTCNGGPLPLWGWWPCRGKLDFKCKGDQANTHYDFCIECTGVAWPVFKTCCGLATFHLETTSDMAATEAIGVTKGKTRTVKVDHHGWKGKISVGLGLSSVHFRANSE